MEYLGRWNDNNRNCNQFNYCYLDYNRSSNCYGQLCECWQLCHGYTYCFQCNCQPGRCCIHYRTQFSLPGFIRCCLYHRDRYVSLCLDHFGRRHYHFGNRIKYHRSYLEYFRYPICWCHLYRSITRYLSSYS